MKKLLPVLLLPLALAGCGSDDAPAADDPVEITVFAAASLKDTFTEIGQEFEADNPGTTVSFSFAGSSDLVTQITEGAPADVFASADTKNMDKAADDVAGTPVDFATNVLEIATPPDNPAGIENLQDLTSAQVVVCAPEVPCGAATEQVEKNAGIDIKPVSEEQSVTDVLNKVISGEADAGLVYVTDVTAAGDDVKGIEFPESADVVNTYPIAALENSDHLDVAQAFADFVAGPKGQAILQAAGFGAP